ncbi:hypothetical protein CFIO01_01398 [Colletotrichum fioriniae PJ7]|uniref:Uncharacterized protein n=1 Tax=Colletotrichum fioriniae PJ7 TaxID=1445577 RepID=A0A010QSN7_9PEZI|nr:hypothetical protein CFIO01_01398 [Colletotrichum fioriniae PJ7]
MGGQVDVYLPHHVLSTGHGKSHLPEQPDQAISLAVGSRRQLDGLAHTTHIRPPFVCFFAFARPSRPSRSAKLPFPPIALTIQVANWGITDVAPDAWGSTARRMCVEEDPFFPASAPVIPYCCTSQSVHPTAFRHTRFTLHRRLAYAKFANLGLPA